MMDAQYMLQMASNPSNWRRTHKKGYEVYVCRPLPGAQCVNRLEGAHYVTDQNKQFIISGTVGETWVIDMNKLAKTYIFADGTPITDTTLSKKSDGNGQMDWQKLVTRPDKTTNWAMLVPKQIQNFPVQTSWGDTLLANRPGIGHGLGDFLVCADNGNGQPNLNDVWVVNGEVFPTTYDLQSFPNMFPPSVKTAKTPYPQQSFMGNGSIEPPYDEYYQDKIYIEKCKFAFKVVNQTLVNKGYSVDNTIGDFNKCTVTYPDEIFRINKENMPNTVVCMNEELVLFDDGFYSILDQINLPDKNDKEGWQRALQWIVKGLSMK